MMTTTTSKKNDEIDHEDQDDDDKDHDNIEIDHDDQDDDDSELENDEIEDDDKGHEKDDIGIDDQDTYNDDQTIDGIARQFPITSIKFASNLDEYCSHPARTFSTLETGQKVLHEISKLEGFAVKKNHTRNTDKIEGECSQRINKEFSKWFLSLRVLWKDNSRCICTVQTTNSQSPIGMPMDQKIKKVDGSYRSRIRASTITLLPRT